MMQTARCILFFCFVFVFFPPLFLGQAILTFIFLLLQLHLRYQLEELPSKSKECNVQVFFGIEWLKSSKHQKRITKNIQKNLQDRLKGIFSVIEKEFVARQWTICCILYFDILTLGWRQLRFVQHHLPNAVSVMISANVFFGGGLSQIA